MLDHSKDSIMVHNQRSEHLTGDQESYKGRRAEPWHKHYGNGNVNGAKEAAAPGPPIGAGGQVGGRQGVSVKRTAIFAISFPFWREIRLV